MQGEIRTLKHKVVVNEERGRILEKPVNLQEQQPPDVNEELDDLEAIVKNLDNAQRKNSIKV